MNTHALDNSTATIASGRGVSRKLALRISRLAVASLTVGAVVATSSLSDAAMGNLTYTQAEVGKLVSTPFGQGTAYPQGGIDTVFMLHGYLIVLSTLDSGHPGATFHVYDVTDPRKPNLLKTWMGPETAKLREWHMYSLSKVGGKDVLACPTISGVAFFDFTDPLNPAALGTLDLAGVSGGDYTNVAWMVSWSWPYLYVGSSGSGVDIVDATDPSKPKFVKNIPIGQIGNFRVGPVTAAGNYLVITNVDQAPFRESVLDVSDATKPSLLTTQTSPSGLYSSVTVGDMTFGGGEGGNYTFATWTPTAIKIDASLKLGSDKGGYCTMQDNFAMCGQSSDGFHKIDISNYAAPKIAMTGVMSAVQPLGDFDFATTLGNLVFQGNDHDAHPGSGLIPHQTAPDTTPPKVLKIYPEDKAVKQPLSTRVTLFFTDEIDTDTISDTSIIVRKSGGATVSGVFSHSSVNAISFGPKQPLDPNTTYEVVIPTGGLKDIAGNAIAAQTLSAFSTGVTVVSSDAGVDPGPGLEAGSATGGSTGGDSGGPSGTGGSGGQSGTGGSAGTGGDSAGSSGSAGAVAGGAGATGGAGAGSAGSGAAGEQAGQAGLADTDAGAAISTSPAGAASGCGCSLPGRSRQGGAAALLLAGVGLALSRMAGRRRKEC